MKIRILTKDYDSQEQKPQKIFALWTNCHNKQHEDHKTQVEFKPHNWSFKKKQDIFVETCADFFQKSLQMSKTTAGLFSISFTL